MRVALALWILGVTLAGAVARACLLGGEPWLDELWSLEIAHSSMGVFTRHDNNHPLNTLWLSCWPPGTWVGWYRLHVFLAGVLSIPLAAWIARRWGRAESGLAALLFAGCFWLVAASADARGYALAILFALLALECLWRVLDGFGWLPLIGFWLAAMLGFLSHLTFVHAYLGFVAWSMRRAARATPSSAGQILQLVRLHGVVAVFFAGYYLLCVRGQEIGGAPESNPVDVLARLISVGLGGPDARWASLPWILIGAGLFVAGLQLLARDEGELWIFFLVSVVVSPILFLLAMRLPFLFERYFFVPFAFFLLVAARSLSEGWRSRWRLAVVAFAAVFLVGSAYHISILARHGRGEFRPALEYILDHDGSPVVKITGDSAFRIRKYLDYYGRSLDDRTVEYQDEPAPWLLIHRLDARHPVPEMVTYGEETTYRQVKSFPAQGPLSWGWFVYERE